MARPKKKIVRLPSPIKTGNNIIASSLDSDLINKIGASSSSLDTFFEGGDISRFSPEIRNPTLNPEMFFLPKYQSNDGSPNIELNTWLDHYYRFDPLIGNLIDLHCGIKGTPVLTNDGLKGIEELTEFDKVVNRNGEFQEVKWSGSRDYDGQFVNVRAIGIIESSWTANHPFLVSKRMQEKTRSGKYMWYRSGISNEKEWVRADELQRGDYLIYPKFRVNHYSSDTVLDLKDYITIHKNRNKTGKLKIHEILTDTIKTLIGQTLREFKRYIIINSDFAEFIGWYLADGNISCNTITFSLHKEEVEECARIMELVKNIFGIECKNKKDRGGDYNGQHIYFVSSAIAEFLKNICGSGAYKKRIPNVILYNSDKEIIKSFVRAYISGDGCIRKGDVLVTTVSKEMAFQFQLLCTKLDMFFKMRYVDQSKYHKVNGLQYILGITKKQYFKVFYPDVPVKLKVKQSNIVKEDENNFYLPISKLSYYNKKETVYDIKTEDSSFLSTVLVHNSSLPISRFGLVGIEDSDVLRFYEEMSEDMEMFEYCMKILNAYFRRGEVLPYFKWSNDRGCFTNMTLVDTNYLTITGHYMLMSEDGDCTELYEVEPDEYIKALINTDNPYYQELLQYLDSGIQEAIETNSTLILDPFSTGFIKRQINTWDLRGSSIMCNILKILLLEDKLRENQYSASQSNINPIRLWTVGSDTFLADDEMLRDTRALIQGLDMDTQKNIVSHHLLKLEVIGATGQTDKLFQDFDYIERQKFTAMWSNKAFTTSEGISYNSASVAMRVLMGRYLPIRTMLENMFYRKVFLPTALKQGFYKTTPKETPNGKSAMIKRSSKGREPLIPRFDWRHKQSLMDDTNVRNMLVSLMPLGMPFRAICESLDLDYDYVKKWKEKEVNTIFDQDLQNAKKILIQSAAGEGLKDKGEGMVKRVMDANTQWAKAVIGNSPNVEIEQSPEGKKEDAENKQEQENAPEMDEQQQTQSPDEETEATEPPEQNEQQKMEGLDKLFQSKEYEAVQTNNINRIIRRYSGSVENQLTKPRGVKSMINSNDLIIMKLRDSYFSKDVISKIKDELYDLKILLAKAGTEYLMAKTSKITNEKISVKMNDYIRRVLAFNEKDYNRRLKEVSELTINGCMNLYAKNKPIDVDMYNINFDDYKLALNMNDIEVLESKVVKSYWDTVYPKLEKQVVDNFVNVIRSKELNCYSNLRIKSVYLNSEKIPIEKVANLTVSDRLLPDTKYKLLRTVNIRKFSGLEVPNELVYKLSDIVKKYDISGTINLKNAKLNDVEHKVLVFHLKNKFDRLDNYNRLQDLYEKYYDDSESEDEWFITNGLKYLQNKKLNKELKEFYENII